MTINYFYTLLNSKLLMNGILYLGVYHMAFTGFFHSVWIYFGNLDLECVITFGNFGDLLTKPRYTVEGPGDCIDSSLTFLKIFLPWQSS